MEAAWWLGWEMEKCVKASSKRLVGVGRGN